MPPVTPLARTVLAALVATAGLAGCADPSSATGSDGSTDSGVSEAAAFQELYDQGIDRYVGAFQPSTTQDMGNGIAMHTFSGDGGPLCYTGEGFHMSTRDGASDALMVLLQGGGACGPNGCESIESWPPGIPGPLRTLGILNADDPSNPAADFDLAYLPYCDGSLWSGDSEVDDDGDGTVDYHFRGLMNLSASLDIAAATFPSPSRILLIGNSAGGFGTHAALPLVRRLFPDVPVDLVNDSGLGIGDPGGQEALNDYWDAWDAYPASCTDCVGDDGNLTGYQSWQLGRDPELRMGFMSYRRDDVVLERMATEPADWEAEMLQSLDELGAAHPDRFRSFVVDGEGHTMVLSDFDLEVGDSSPRAWLADLLGDGAWVSVSE